MRKLLYTIIIFATLTTCKKSTPPKLDNPYGLPNATQTGAGMFACLINGQPFIAGENNTITYSNGAFLRGDTLYINGQPKDTHYYEGIQFDFEGNLQQGFTHNLDIDTNNAIYASDSSCMGFTPFGVRSFANSGTIQLTKFDTINKIASGTFNFSFAIPNCDTLHITYGRFDYRIN